MLVDDAACADAVLVFVSSRADLNRDSLAALLGQRDVRPVLQVSIDATWSALRFRPSR